PRRVLQPLATRFCTSFRMTCLVVVSARKYRQIKTDIQPILTDLEMGSTLGDRIPGVTVEVYKVRARNSDSTPGKSGGYRIVYQVTSENTVILIPVYSKTEQSDISRQEIRNIITEYQQEYVETVANNEDEEPLTNEQRAEQGASENDDRERSASDDHTNEEA
ncbi:MAG: hypothetical protein MI924_34655, partial [Chloroflexales bacterium]|nr:hypothetical protein [Chloroflexales bacterium]